MAELPEAPLQGEALLQKLKELADLPRREIAKRCGYYTRTENGQTRINLEEFYDAVLAAKGVPLNSKQAEDGGTREPSYVNIRNSGQIRNNLADFYNAVLAAKAKPNRYLTRSDFSMAKQYYARVTTSIEAAAVLTKKAEEYILGAVDAVFEPTSRTLKKENLIERVAEDLKMIIYCLVSGKNTPIDEYLRSCKAGENDDLFFRIRALQHIREHHELTGLAAEETNKYINYLVDGLHQRCHSLSDEIPAT